MQVLGPDVGFFQVAPPHPPWVPHLAAHRLGDHRGHTQGDLIRGLWDADFVTGSGLQKNVLNGGGEQGHLLSDQFM